MNYEARAYEILDLVTELTEKVKELKATGNEIEKETRADAIHYIMRDLAGLQSTVDRWAAYESDLIVKKVIL